VFKSEFRVDYVDTDAMGVVHHASYCRWLERARVHWLDSVGEPYRKMEADGMAFPLRELNIVYKKPLRFDDRAVVEISDVDMEALTVEIRYRILSEDHKKVHAVASTRHVLVKMIRKENQASEVEMKLLPIPEHWRKKWQQLRDPK